MKQFTFRNKKRNIINGVRSGGRKQLDERNKAIKEAFKSGIAIHQLAEEYFLSGKRLKRLCILNKRKESDSYITLNQTLFVICIGYMKCERA